MKSIRGTNRIKIVLGGEREITEYEIVESEFVSGKDLQGKTGLSIKILSEITNMQTDFGPKPTAKVLFKEGLTENEKDMRFNQIFINYLVRQKGKDSKKWVGFEVPITTKTIKGNLAIVPKVD